MKLDHEDIAFVERIEERLQNAPVGRSDAAVLGRIHSTLASTPPSRTSRPWPRIVGLVAAAGLLVAVVFLRPTPPLTAAAMTGTLRFEPAAPMPGQRIHVAYTPSAALSRYNHLRLRARFRTAHSEPTTQFESQVAVTRLERDRAGAFVGQFTFPDSAVFGAFAVEDVDGRRTDANRRSLWTLLASDSAGVPTFEALEQRIGDVATTNWELALATAEQATSLHPDQVRGWVILLSLQRSVLSRAASDSAVAVHRLRLPQLDANFDRGVSSEELGAMIGYASSLGDETRAARWEEALGRAAPHGMWGVDALLTRGLRFMPKDPRAAMAFFDSLWRTVGPVHSGILNFGLNAAQVAKDSAAESMWMHRMLASGLTDTVRLAGAMTRSPLLADEAMELLRGQLRAPKHDVDRRRPLEVSRDDARPLEDDRRALVLSLLGDGLIAHGKQRAGLDTLELAAEIGWNPSLYRRIAARRLALGDTARALRALENVAADPLTSSAFVDSARSIVGRLFDEQRWASAVKAARRDRQDRMLSRSERTSLPEPLRVTDAGGRVHQLRDLSGGRPTLVAFWSMRCPPSIAQHAALAATAQRIAPLGYHTVAITHEALDSAMLAKLAERKLDFAPYRDQNNEVRLALAQWGTPEYFILDGRGRLRFRSRDLASVAAQLAAVDE